jgi:Zinc knuckle.
MTRIANAMTAMEQNQFRQHVQAVDLVNTITGWLNEAKNHPNPHLRSIMVDNVKTIMRAMNMQFMPAQPYDDLVHRDHNDDGRGVTTKILTKLPEFSGNDPNFGWDAFYITFSMTAQTANYTESDLKALFLSRLKGDALMYYHANFEQLQPLDWRGLMSKYAHRFGSKKTAGLQGILGITQKAGEDVMAFRDRLTIAAKPMVPPRVPLYKQWYHEGRVVEIDNPDYDEEILKRNAALQQHYAYLVQIFLTGLRKEILDRLNTTEFRTLDEAAQAALEAEDYLKSVKQLHSIHHLTCESPEVNAVKSSSKPLNDMEQRGVPKGKTMRSTTNDDVCFKCNRKGHWSRDCPSARSRPDSRTNSRSNSRGRKNFDQADHSLHQKLDKLVELLTIKGSGRNASKSRSRSRGNSRGRSHSRSGSKSRYGSQNRSQNRSQSRGRDRYRNKSNSRSNPIIDRIQKTECEWGNKKLFSLVASNSRAD